MPSSAKTRALFFPFDLFGGGGARAGAELLCDAFQELLDDNRRERQPTRAKAYSSKTRWEEFAFDKPSDYEGWRPTAQAAIQEVLDAGDRLLWVSGNHLGVLPLYESLNDTDLVIQFDAHLDIYHLSDCTSELSHGNFLLHAARLPRVVNVGHRELLLTPDHIAKSYERVFPASDLACDPAPALEGLRDAASRADRVVIDLDCDVFDLAYFPAIADPRPLGLSPAFLVRCLEALRGTNIVGFAISEFDPARDVRDQSLGTLVWLMEFLLLWWHEKRSST